MLELPFLGLEHPQIVLIASPDNIRERQTRLQIALQYLTLHSFPFQICANHWSIQNIWRCWYVVSTIQVLWTNRKSQWLNWTSRPFVHIWFGRNRKGKAIIGLESNRIQQSFNTSYTRAWYKSNKNTIIIEVNACSCSTYYEKSRL